MLVPLDNPALKIIMWDYPANAFLNPVSNIQGPT